MDVAFTCRPAVVAVLSLFALTACNENTSSNQTTFPETKVECTGTAIPNRFLVHWKDGSISIEEAKDRQAFIKEILEPNEGDIEFAEHDQVVKLSEPGQLQGQSIGGDVNNWGQERTEAPAVWTQGVTGQGVVVAVIDSGADITHEQLQNQLSVNAGEIPDNGIDDDGNGLVDDVHGYDFESMSGDVNDQSGHGTHVAGIILADHSAGPIQGMAPGAKLLPLDFMNGSNGAISDAIKAMYYAASRGAKVINASWGGAPCSKTLQKAILDIEVQGTLFVSAAGNSGYNLDVNPEYPAAFGLSGQITVGASTDHDIMIKWSNYSSKLVDLVAPGTDIWSTYPNHQQYKLNGTSMAAPFVSGAAALLWSVRPGATVAQIKAALMKSVDQKSYAVVTNGRLNVRKAVEEIIRLVPQ